MATDLLSYIPRSVDETVVKSYQNAGIAESAKQGAAITDQDTINKKIAIQGEAEIQHNKDLANVLLATKINEVQGGLTKEVEGTRTVLEQQEIAYREKLAEYMKITQDSSEYSMYTNPVHKLRENTKILALKEQLNDMADGMSAGYQHIDTEYGQAATKVQDFRATVLNLNQADLNMKAHELETQTKLADAEVAGAERKRILATNAIEKQQFTTDPNKKALDARDADYMKNLTYRAMYTLSNNGSDAGYNAQVARVMEQNFESSSLEKRNAITNLTAKLVTLPEIQPTEGETVAAFNERKVQRLLAVAGTYGGPEIAELGASLGTTKFNPLFKLGADTVNEQLMATAEVNYATELGITPELLTAPQRQMAYRVAKAKGESLSAKDKISAAAATIQGDLTTRASMSSSAIPPFDFAASAPLMASANVNPEVAAWFGSDTAKQAINNWVVQTGRQAPDVALGIMDGLQEVVLPNGKKLSDAERAKVAATYVRQMFLKDYLAHGDHGESYSALQQLAPGSELKFKALLKLPQYGGVTPFDLTNPEDLLNLKARIQKNDYRAPSASDETYNSQAMRGVVK